MLKWLEVVGLEVTQNSDEESGAHPFWTAPWKGSM